jgi:hypothetical protein
MIEYLPLVLTGIGLAASIVYYANIIQNANKARQRDTVFQKLQGFTLEYIKTYVEVASYTDWKTPDEFREKYGRITNPEAYAKYIYINRAYELAGILLMEKMADPELLFKLYPAGAVISIWETFSPYILDQRRLRNNPERNAAFEYLYNEAKRIYPDIRHRDVEYN